MLYRVDESSSWRFIRRAKVDGPGLAQLALSDGTVFVREYDTTTTFDEQIMAYAPGKPGKIVWREAEATDVRAHIGDEMLPGPLVK